MASRTLNQEDWLSETGATKLAARITHYWTSRGYNVTVTVENVRRKKPGGHVSAAYGIKSDLIGGLPMDWRGPMVMSMRSLPDG
jgi:hypothetical protein